MKKIIISIALVAALLIAETAVLSPSASAYTPKYQTLRVGLYSTDSANLENDVGSGFRFGYLDGDRDFVDLGVGTDVTRISVNRDSNMYYVEGDNSYYTGKSDTYLSVGCHHLKLTTPFSTYSEAAAAAEEYEDSFVRYENGSFYVMFESFTLPADAEAAASYYDSSEVVYDSGTTYCVCVVATGTSDILLEFDDSGDQNRQLCVMPVSSSKSQTWARGYSYYGGFEYQRFDGGDVQVVNIVDVEDYVKGVIPYEMSNSWPLEALKTQACCARTYAMYCINCGKHNHYDICNTTDCQVYYGTNSANSTTDNAVESTKGQYVTYNGTLCQTYYSSSNGGASESSKNVWGGDFPYLVGVIDPYEKDIADFAGNYHWSETYTNESLTQRLYNKGYLNSGENVTNLEISKLSEVGNVIGIKIYYTDSSGSSKSMSFTSGSRVCSILNTDSIRFTISSDGSSGGGSGSEIYINDSSYTGDISELYATGSGGVLKLGLKSVYALSGSGTLNEIGEDSGDSGDEGSGTYYIVGTGWGHNVGMSQWGAYSMAKYYGKTYDEIIKFYYTGVSVG